jgi:hypothetical protein
MSNVRAIPWYSRAEYARNFEVITDGSARHQHTFPHRGFLPWRFSDAGPQRARHWPVIGPSSENLHISGRTGPHSRSFLTRFG